jgi:hypothetical protein
VKRANYKAHNYVTSLSITLRKSTKKTQNIRFPDWESKRALCQHKCGALPPNQSVRCKSCYDDDHDGDICILHKPIRVIWRLHFRTYSRDTVFGYRPDYGYSDRNLRGFLHFLQANAESVPCVVSRSLPFRSAHHSRTFSLPNATPYNLWCSVTYADNSLFSILILFLRRTLSIVWRKFNTDLQNISLLCSVQIGSGAHTNSYPVGTGRYSPRV